MKNFLTILISMCLISVSIFAYDIHKNKNADPVALKGGESTSYANADEAVVSSPCIVYSITFLADTAGEDVIMTDGLPGTRVIRVMEGLANNTKTVTFPYGLKFDTEVYVDVDAGDEVYVSYDLQ